MAAYTIVMAVVLYAVKTWVQKNECLIWCDLYYVRHRHHLSHATVDADTETAVFAENDFENDDWFGRLGLDFSKKSDAPGPLFQPQAVYGR